MIKSSTASTTKSPSTQLPPKSAWAKGPPRSQSPAPNNTNSNANANAVPSHQPSHQTHSRRPSALGGAVPIKDGVSVPRGNLGAAKQSGAINFGSVNEQQSAPITSSSTTSSSSPPIKAESRHVQSFGTISAQQPHSNTSNSSVNGKPTNGTASTISSTSSTPGISSPATSISASSLTPSKPDLDVKSLFRGSGTPVPSAPQTASSISASYADNFKISSPPIRSAGLPPHSHPSHPSQQHTPNGAPHQPQPLTPHFGNFGGPRQGGGPAGGAGGGNHPQPPRSPSYPRQISNGMNNAANGGRPPPISNNNIPGGGPGGAGGPAGPTPPNSSTNVTNANAMSSPRLGPPQHHPHPGHPQHQHSQMPPMHGQPMHGQPMQGVPGMQGMQGMQMPGVGVNVPQPMAMPGWTAGPYYPQYYAIPEHYLAQGYPPPHQWQGYHPQQHPQQHLPQHPQHHPLPLPHQSPAPSTPLSHVHGLPVSPRQPPPPLQTPGTPPAGGNALSINTGPGGLTSPPPSARLNSGASTFVPGHGVRQSKVVIKDLQGQEIDLSGLSKKSANTGSPVVEKIGFLSERSGGAPSPSQAEKRRSTPVRMETEEAKKRRIADEEEKAKKKEIDKEKEVLEKKRKEEAKRLKEEEEKRRVEEKEKEKERERIRVEEEKKRKEEEERLRQEEERIRKEMADKERLRVEEEERARLSKLKQEEEERLRREEEILRLKKEEEERLREEELQEQERLKREEEEKERAKAIALAAEEAIKIQERMADSQLETVAEVESEKPEDDLNIVVTPSLSPIPVPSPAPSTESHKRRPIPGPLDLSSTNRHIPQPLSSALATARHIQDLGQVAYPEGIRSPKVELNANAKDGRFRYDREFLLQFMNLCKEKPENLPPLDAIGMVGTEPGDTSHQMSRGGSSRGRNASAGPSTINLQRQPSIGLGITGSGKIGGAMGQFATIGKMGDERFGQLRSASSGSMPPNLPFGGRPAPLGRTPSQGGPNGVTGSSLGNKRTRSKRGEQRNEANRVNNAPVAPPTNYNIPVIPGFEPVAPLEQSVNRWVANSTKRGVPVDVESSEVVDKKVRALLNKLSMEKFESISNQIIAWANRSEREKDGRTLIQVIRLVFEKATDEANWSEMYARLCRKMMEQISPNVQDETIKNSDGKPIAGGLLFRKYLLNRCQEDFERGWTAKEKTAKAAAEKASEDQAAKEAAEKSDEEAVLYSEEYYAAQKAKRQGLGLVKFIGELFKLQMLTERIMHECIKKALSNVDDPEEEEIESLCKLLTTVGMLLDTNKAHAHMDVYFARIRELSKSANVTSRMQFMLQDVIELRERKWIPRSLAAAPSTIAQVHEAAAKEKQEKEAHGRVMSNISRGGSRRGTERGEAVPQAGADGWTPAARVSTKAGDLSNFGKINKPTTATMNFAPVNVFSKKDVKGRESHSLSRTNSSANMYSLLEHTGDPAAHAAHAASASAMRAGRPATRMTSVDLTQSGLDVGAPLERPKLMLQKRSIPIPAEIKTDITPAASAPVSASEEEEGELKEEDIVVSNAILMTEAEMDKKIEEDIKEFFSIRNIEEAEDYFISLPDDGRYRLVDKLVMTAIEKKEADAKLVSELFERVAEKGYCTLSGFELGFTPTAELLDDIAIDAPKAIDLMAIMLQGAKLDDDTKSRIASKSESSERLISLTTS